MITRLPLIAAFFLLSVIGVCAAPPERTQYPLTIVDDAGNTVVLPARPLRIVSLTLPTDEILLSLVDRTRILAVTTLSADPAVSSVPDQVAEIPNKLTMNLETIVSLHPDLVLVANWSDAAPVKQLRDAGLPVYLMASGLSVAGIEEKIQRLALMTDESERGRVLVTRLREKISGVSKKLSAIPKEERLRVLDYTTFGASMGRGSSWDEIVRLAGLVNVVGDLATDEWGQVPLSKEKLIVLDPDIIVVPGWLYGDPKGAEAFFSQALADPALSGLSAMKAKRVYMMPENLRTSTSQYFGVAVEWLARTAYPRLFQ